jgi:hypothetical protein
MSQAEISRARGQDAPLKMAATKSVAMQIAATATAERAGRSNRPAAITPVQIHRTARPAVLVVQA